MRFTTRILYGLKAVLILASRYGEGSLPVSQIAKKEGISVAYLEQILNALKRKGLVKSVRGPQGGYILSKNPATISLESLFYTLEDKGISAADSKMNISPETDEATIANYIFWKKLKSSIESGLGTLTLKDLMDESRRVKRSKPRAHYAFNI